MRISEVLLAKELRMSRTPVREAVQQLDAEGVLEHVPRVGTVVRAPDRQVLIELYEMREALEGFAAAEAVERLASTDLEMLERICRETYKLADALRASGKPAFDEAMQARFLKLDRAFHSVFVYATGNSRIRKTIEDSHLFSRIFGYRRRQHTLAVVARAYRFHRRILRAVKRRDAEAARKLMAEHIRQSRHALLEWFDAQQRTDEAHNDLEDFMRSLGEA